MAAAAETPGSSASPHQERFLQSLSARGWCFRDPSNEIIQELLHASPSPSPEAVETELVDVDLRLFGGKSLPDRAAAAATGRRLSYLHGPIVLQVPMTPLFCFDISSVILINFIPGKKKRERNASFRNSS